MLRQLKLVSKCKVLPSDIQSECVDFSCGLTTLLQCDNTVLSVMTLSQSDLSLLLFFVLTNGSRMHKLLVRLNKMTHAGGEWSKSCLRMNRLWHVSSADNWDHDHLVPWPSCFTRRLSFFCSSCPALGPPRRWRKLFFWLFWLPVLAKCLIILNRCPFYPRWRLPLAPTTRALFQATLFFLKIVFHLLAQCGRVWTVASRFDFLYMGNPGEEDTALIFVFAAEAGERCRCFITVRGEM